MPSFTAVLFATVVRVVDGDTLVVNLPCNIDVLCSNVPVRIEHIDTPELHGKCDSEKALAQKAKALVSKILPKNSEIVITNPKRDMYYRLLADVPVVSKALFENGLAKPYEGGHKNGWC